MGDHEEYRKHASECQALAAKTKDMTQRAQLLKMAEAWTGLAERAAGRDAKP